MAQFDYLRIKGISQRLHSRFQQGSVVLVRRTPGVIDPAKPFEPVQPQERREALSAVTDGVSSRLVDGETILATDLEVQCYPPAMGVEAGDALEMDGKEVVIIRSLPYPPEGETVYHTFIVRS